MTASSIQRLRTEIAGQVIAPVDAEYERARLVLLPQIDRRPAAIVRPVDADEVASVVGLAHERGLEPAVRSGGHSAAGYGIIDGGIVIDVWRMKGLQIDPGRRTAWAETGLTAGEYTNAAGARPGDRIWRYRIRRLGGLTLGGGVGYLVRKLGLTIDGLLAPRS